MELFEYTAHELAHLIRKKEVSVPEIVKSVYKNIKNKDNDIGAYISLQEESAMIEAQNIQNEFEQGNDMPALAGIPIAIKDNICTKGIKTTCASKMLSDFVPPYNATVIERLKENKAIIIGKTNLDEFAMGGSTENSAYKLTKNPHNLNCVPGGSSGGSAAAVASNETIVALGTDTGGSIRQPASFCGIIGLKPTYGLVSRFGLVAFASSLDQVGPMGKDVEDVAIVLNAICGFDKNDATTVSREKVNYKTSLTKDVQGLKVGVVKEFLDEGINTEVKNKILESIKELKSKGAVVEEISIPNIKYALSIYYIIASAEASSNLSRYDGIKYGFRNKNATNLDDLYQLTRMDGFGNEVKRRIMLGTYVLSSGYYEAYYNKALKARTVIKNEFDKAFEKFDVLVGPTAPTTAFKLGEKSENPLEMYMSDICTVPVNIAGLPAISVPVGNDSEGLPVGLQIIGKAYDELTILQVANNIYK